MTIKQLIGILVILFVTSCKINNEPLTRTIKVTSDNNIEFNMQINGTIEKNITTPYEFTYNEEEGDFIFSSTEQEENIEIEMLDIRGSLVLGTFNATGPKIRFRVKGDEMRTY